MPRKHASDRADYNRAYREKNAEKRKAAHRQWYEQNREKALANAKHYRSLIPKDVMRARRKRWSAAHRDREQKRYHATRAWLPWLNAFRGSKQRAKKALIAFTITKDWAIKTWTGRCAVTNIEFVLSNSRSPYLFSPSIDRIIPSLGYTPENSRFVLHAVNALKGAGTDADMLRIAKAIIDQNCAPPIPYTHAPELDLAHSTS